MLKEGGLEEINKPLYDLLYTKAHDANYNAVWTKENVMDIIETPILKDLKTIHEKQISNRPVAEMANPAERPTIDDFVMLFEMLDQGNK